jgi:predicted MFS family arabinose efflux permease
MNLLGNRAFRSLWAANTASTFGTMFGALSLTALIYLDASPTEIGILGAATSLPVLLFALAAGVWVDRLPRVPLMVTADVGRFALLMTVPLAALAGHLQMEQLYAVSFLTGSLNVMFDVAFRSLLPAVVAGERLVDANSALAISGSIAATASPAAGGAIAQTAGAPIAVLLDAATFLLSALFIGGTPVRGRNARSEHRGALSDALEGLRTVLRQRALRAVFGMVVTYSFFGGFIITLYGLWVIKELGFSAFTLGILLAAGGIGSLVGASLAAPAARRLGLGRTIVTTYVVAAMLLFLTPLAGGAVWVALAMLLVEQCVGDAFWTVHNINALTLRQRITPNAQLGRVNAAFLLASHGLRPLGAIVAGLTAELVGVRGGLFIASAGISLAAVWLVLSPLVRTDQFSTDLVFVADSAAEP